MTGICNPLPADTSDGQLEINGVDLICPAWDVVSLRGLWTVVATRGSNVRIPTVQGAKKRRRRIDEARARTLDMVIIGEYDRLGSLNADPRVGLETNLNYLRENVMDPPTAAALDATLTMPSGAERTAEVQIESFELGEGTESLTLATVTFTIVGGVFE